MPVSYRDVEFKRQKRFDEKIDRTKTIKAVIVDSLGNDSGSGDIWADRLSRRVWVRELGTAGSSQVICYNIEPVIGLGVILGYEIGSNTREVLRTDKEFFGPTNPTGTSYESPSLTDFLPGGRFALWVASKMISPLSTYPSSTGLSVNVVAGDYPYAGTRKTFAGQTSIALTQNPNAGQHYYAGLYLDSANTLQVVYGASVVLATTPPEPAWPAGAFRLSVVRVNDTQTGITLAQDTDLTNDIRDRRMPWSDEATHNLLSATHPDTLTGSVVAGDIVYGNSTPKWARLPKGSDGQVLTLASGLPSWAAAGGGTAASQATVDAGTNTTEFVNPSTLASASTVSRVANIFINGAFDVWQRTVNDTTVTSTAVKYVSDRWWVITGAGTLANVQRSTTVRTGALSKYSLEMVGATGVTTVQMAQRIESMYSARYKRTVAFSCYIFNGSGADFTPKIYALTPNSQDVWLTSAIQNGGGSGENLQSCVDNAWTKMTWSADTSGYSNIDNGFGIMIEIPSGSLVASDTVRFAEMNLVPGTAFNPIEISDPNFEKMKCLRYYEEIGSGAHVNDFFGNSQAASTTGFEVQLDFSEKRVAPTITISALADFIVHYVAGGNITPATMAPSNAGVGLKHSWGTGTVGSAVLVARQNIFVLGATTSARIYVNAEL